MASGQAAASQDQYEQAKASAGGFRALQL